ncbi:sugar-binding protein [Chryseobacterium lactis]|uniref:RHS repeat-associated core domain-containing protein n=1 Tax=Chryseobacterium lactis TaxID=1241981 RepID=A0A3G6RM34_CHRLC|nr:DUF6443 domain-containing protein [Chryseobacterium lactis]AZA84950.1 RHS repeat-associated core domain-containing protein [Chryseobacterium lactis]AZB05338.1 RHS repeat-associated core domain-containing protein [Chryseobacterium lactis]PNW11487.1 sugar-binding protein [Chryseobacterium lactis]
MKNQLLLKLLMVCGVLSAAISVRGQSTSENFVQSKDCLNQDCSKKVESVVYYDGLGRPKQVVNVKASPTGKDLVTPVTYDGFGRQTKNILPTPVGSQNSAIHSGITNENQANSYYGTTNAYSEKVLENSPLDRVLEQGQAGDPWKIGAGHTQKMKYEANTGNEVMKFLTSTSTNTVNTVSNTVSSLSIYSSNSGNYPAGILYKNTVTDEDGSPVTRFENARGQTILIRKTDGTQNIDTYYVYDEYNNKAFVIPPKAIEQIKAGNNTITQNTLDELCYQYRYDGRGREVEKKLPGKDWDYTIYDKSDRAILTQDANLRKQGNWLMTKYDSFGRVIYTGIVSGGSRADIQVQLTDLAIVEWPTPSGFTRNGMVIYYTNGYFEAFHTILTVNYYDSYPRDTPGSIPTKILDQYTAGSDDEVTPNGMQTASYVKNVEDDNWTKTYLYYDTEGKLIGQNSLNHLGGYTKKELKLDFSGQVQENYTYHKKSPSDPEVKIKERFVYDEQNRPIKYYHQVDSRPEELLVENTYNEIGQLVNKKIGNTTGTPLQSVDMTYNIRGWLTKVNDPQNLNGKLFAYEIKYQNPVYSNVSTGKYNGNISEIDWASADNGKLRRYNYKYDSLERLKNGIYSEPNTTVPQNNYYNETLSYDVNGNILNLKRNRFVENLGVQLMDDLDYKYTGNKLSKVDDTSGNYAGYPSPSGSPMTYDSNGNMTSHIDKGILQIDYNYLNLPNYVKFYKEYVSHDWENTYYVNTKYLYNAAGAKLRKIYTYGSGRTNMETVENTDYLDGFQYWGDELSFVSTSEGYYDFKKNTYIYNYTDQVGNIRLAYYKDASGNPKIDRATNFYPFGLEFGGDLSTSNSITPNYTYSSQGQEKQRETGWSSYRWRNYDATMARFFNVDPLAESYHTWSPFAFSGNRVVDARELEGLEPKKVNEVSLPGDPIEFAEFIGGGINSIRAAFSNSVIRTGNVVANNRFNSKYEVDNEGFLTLMTGVPKESFKEKVVNGAMDLATLGLAAFGGVEGALTAQGGKVPFLKAFESVKEFQKIEARAARLNKVGREGKDFTKAGKQTVIKKNEIKYGKVKCESCGIETTPAEQSKKGVVPKKSERQVDHLKRKREGGRGNPDNGQVLCRGCNLDKH